MKQSIIKSHLTEALALGLGAACLITLLAAPAFAAGKKTYFTTVEYPVGDPTFSKMFTDGQKMFIVGAESAYMEEASDPRVTGPKLLNWDAVFELPAMTGPMWGKSHKQHEGGAWDGYWFGTRTAFTDADGVHVRTTIISMAEGSGIFAGMVVRWDITGVDADQGRPMTSSGYIIEAKGGPSDRPIQSRSQGTERVQVTPGFVILPPPGGPGAMATWDILNETLQISHLGRCANDGFGFLDPLTGQVRGGGVLTSANGDQLYWVATGASLGPNGPIDLTLHFAGGTGRFDAAVGAISGALETEMTPTQDPLVSIANFSMSANGSIRY